MRNGKWKIVFLVFLASALAAGTLAYKRWPQLFKKPTAQKAVNSSNQDQFSSAPPFSTKEPQRYQATRIITSVEYRNGSPDAARRAGETPAVPVETVTSKTLIARDGNKRREEYDNGTDAATIYLDIPMGRFVILPAKKLYADLNLASSDLDSVDSQSDVYSEFSPERLLNETRSVARYENLGAEILEGRSTTKYRVTMGESTKGTEDGSVTLIWIDDALGMPIRSETNSESHDHFAKVTVELRDLKQEVDSQMFELPKDFKKVDYSRLRAGIPQTRDAQAKRKGSKSVEANLVLTFLHRTAAGQT